MRTLLLLFFLLIVLPARAEIAPLLLEAPQHMLIGHLERALDRQHALTIETVTDAPFQKVDGNLNLGFTRTAVWLRFTVMAPDDAHAPWLLEVSPSWLSRLSLYTPKPGGGFDRQESGNSLDSTQREVLYRNAIFRLNLQAGQAQTLYLRIESVQSLRARLVIWQPQAFASKVALDQFQWGAYAGLVLALILSIVSYWWITREPEYLVLTVSAFMMLLTRLLSEGGLQHWLSISAALRDPLVGCALVLTSATGTQFVNRFTRLALYFPRLAPAFTGGLWAMALLACVCFWLDLYTETMPFVQIAIILSVLLHSALTVWLVRRGQAQSLTVLMALGAFWIVIPIRMVQSLGWFPIVFNDNLVLHGSQIAYLCIMNYAGHKRYAEMRLENANTQTLHEAVLRLEQANALERTTHQAHRQFVATLSHELRNPLAVIGAAIQNLAQQAGQDWDEKNRKRIDKIQDAADRLTLIIDECLTPEYIDVAPMANQRRPVLLYDLLQDAAEAAGKLSDSHQVHVECDATLRLRCNPELIKLALRTLTDNAVKYTPPGSHIELRGSSDGQVTLIQIRDDGPGIDSSDLPHIFEKFYRGQTAMVQPGTGLGLVLAKQVFESHGGTLDVANGQDGGVICTIRLPKAR
ncbi:MAG: sensor histidine kinase [Rhodoferax sp.]|nr:sensor histidine kinase [Rhodoferax sp.]